MRTWTNTSWVGRFSLNFFRFSSKLYPRCLSFRARLEAVRLLSIRARGSPRPFARGDQRFRTGLSNIRLDPSRSVPQFSFSRFRYVLEISLSQWFYSF